MAQTASTLLALVTSVMCNRGIDLTNVVQMYCGDMPSPKLFLQEHTQCNIKVPCEVTIVLCKCTNGL